MTINLSGNGKIYSPYYPNSYPVNSNCKWLLKSSEGNRFKLGVVMNRVGYNGLYSNKEDYIMLYNSSTIKNDSLFAVLKGRDDQSLDLISHSEVLIVFISDNRDYRNVGFVINYIETSE